MSVVDSACASRAFDLEFDYQPQQWSGDTDEVLFEAKNMKSLFHKLATLSEQSTFSQLSNIKRYKLLSKINDQNEVRSLAHKVLRHNIVLSLPTNLSIQDFLAGYQMYVCSLNIQPY